MTTMRETPRTTAVDLGENRTSIISATPDQINSVLLADGWHEVSDAELVQFAVSKGMSPPIPDKYYPSLKFTDKKSNNTVICSLNQILAFDLSSSYQG